MEKLQRFIDSTFKSFLFFCKLSRTTHVCIYQICPLVLKKKRGPQSTRLSYAAAAVYGNFSMIWAASASRAKSLRVHPEITLGSCVPVQPGPCSHSDVTLTDSRPDNSIHAPPASCQSGRPSWGYWRSCQPVWDVSVKAHPLCHSVSLPGQSDIRLLSPFHPSLRLHLFSFHSLSVRLLPVFLQRHGSPLIPDPITDSLGTHLSSSDPQVFVMECFTNTCAGDSGLIYMWYNCSLYLFVPPSALNTTVTNPFLFVSLFLLLLLCSLTLHLSTWQVTRSGPAADWLIGGLSYLSIVSQSHAKPDQARPDHLVGWPRAQSFFFFFSFLVFPPKTRSFVDMQSLVPLQQPSGYGSSLRPHPVKSPN